MINPPPTHWIQRIGMIALPLILAGFWVYTHVIVPAPIHYRYDPEFPYLMSSLTPFKGHLYAFIDHPGTPLEVVGTALLFLTYPFIPGGHDAFILYHLAHPEVFLMMARALLTLASMVCVFLLIRDTVRVTHWIDALFAVAVAASFYALHPRSFNTLVFWSHNSLTFPAGTLLLWYLFVVFRRDGPIPRWKFLLMGFWAGVLTATQLYFLTWSIGITTAVLLLGVLERAPWGDTFWDALNAFGGSVLGFFVSVIPILPIFHTFAAWITDLILHQGKYGEGESGITSPEQMSTNLNTLIDQIPLTLVMVGATLILLVVAFFLQRRQQVSTPRLWALAGGLSLQCVATIFIILKHTQVIYMLAVAAIVPLLLAVLHAMIGSHHRYARYLYLLFSVAVFAGFGNGVAHGVNSHETRIALAETHQSLAEPFLAEHARSIDKPQDEMIVLWSYGPLTRCNALLYGSRYTNLQADAFQEELEQLCPAHGHYRRWQQMVYFPDGALLPAEQATWDIIVVRKPFFDRHPYLRTLGDSHPTTGTEDSLVFITPRP